MCEQERAGLSKRAAAFLLAVLLWGCATPDPAQAPGVAFAWATFDRDAITGQGAVGLADRSQARLLTIDDPARVASVSKLVVALGVMRLVEQGRLDLDRDVSDWLGWPLRNPAYADRPITLRMLLSHRSSLVDGIDYAIPLGTALEHSLADPAAFDGAHPPGDYFRYSNLNFPVVATVMERATGERFDRLMARLVLEPLELDACFNWTSCSDAAVIRAVVLYAPDGAVVRDDLGGRRPACPVLVAEGAACDLSGYAPGSNGALFSPQGGLRISVRDLAALAQLLLNEGSHRGRAFLSPASIDAMLTPVWRFDGRNGETESGFYCAYGLASQTVPTLAFGCRDDLFGDRRPMTGHAGEAYGVRSGLWIDRARGTGIAYLATGNGDDPARGRSAYSGIEEWLAGKLTR